MGFTLKKIKKKISNGRIELQDDVVTTISGGNDSNDPLNDGKPHYFQCNDCLGVYYKEFNKMMKHTMNCNGTKNTSDSDFIC